MKSKLIATLLVLLATSLMAASTPAVEARLVQLNTGPDIFASPGPVTLQYQLTIKNPLVNHSLTLRRVTLRTQPGSAYLARADNPITMVINPESSVTINLSAQGRPSEGLLRNQAPVHMNVKLWFDRQNGKPFSKQFVQDLAQF
jgi:hypothetical protein